MNILNQTGETLYESYLNSSEGREFLENSKNYKKSPDTMADMIFDNIIDWANQNNNDDIQKHLESISDELYEHIYAGLT